MRQREVIAFPDYLKNRYMINRSGGVSVKRMRNDMLPRRHIQIPALLIAMLMVGGWSDVSTVDRMTDKKISAYAVSARQPILFAGQKIAAYLVLGCIAEVLDGTSKLGSYVRFSQQIAEFSSGRFRFDDGEIQEFRNAGGGQGGDTIEVAGFYYSDFPRVISSSSRFRMDAQLVTGHEFLEFNTKGAREIIAKLPCKWTR